MPDNFNADLNGITSLIWKIFWRAIPFIGIFLLLSMLWSFAIKPLIVIDKVTNPDRMIYTYEHFHNLYQKVLASKKQIEIKEEEIKIFKDTMPDNWREDTNLVAEYNADAEKATKSFLRDNKLPDHLSQ